MQPQNLRDIIIRSKISPWFSSATSFKNCSSSDCQLHDYTVTSDTFTSAATKQTFQIQQNLDCNSHNVIYLVSCNKPECGKQYVGETGRQLRDRVVEHLRDIKYGKNNPVGLHFRSYGHNSTHFTVQAFEKCRFDSTGYRKTKESFWIEKIKPAINKQKATHYTFSNLRKKFRITKNKTKSRYQNQRR